MITAPVFAGRTYGVLGLARSGQAAEAALAAAGATVWSWDDNPASRAGKAAPGQVSTSRFVDDGIGLGLTDPDGLHRTMAPDGRGGLRALVDFAAAPPAALARLAALVVSPGIPHSAPAVRAALAAGVPLSSDIQLFAECRPHLPPHRVVGITGTNGKSTTTALIHHLLVHAGRQAAMGGNIGLPILAQAPLPDGGTYVLELSSYQLDITHSLACDVAVLLNITPDHLERHGSMAGYAAAKARLFAMQAGGVAVVGRDAAATFPVLPPAVTPVFIEEVDLPGQADWPALQGPHNLQNARAAAAAVRALGLTDAEIAAGLATYPGLPHRMERLGEKRGLLWINDSKATNADSTAPALKAFPRTHWIAGGRPKRDGDGRADLAAALPHLSDVKAAYLIGEAESEFAALLDGRVPLTRSGTLEQAVRDVLAAAAPGDTVLLSPACASFDQFRDFEARGEAFRTLVEGL